MSTERLRAALAQADAPSVDLMIQAFDALRGTPSDRERFMTLLAVEAWYDAGRMLVPDPWRPCISEQVPIGAWAALGLRPNGYVRHWQHHGHAKVVPHAIAIAALVAAEAAA